MAFSEKNAAKEPKKNLVPTHGIEPAGLRYAILFVIRPLLHDAIFAGFAVYKHQPSSLSSFSFSSSLLLSPLRVGYIRCRNVLAVVALIEYECKCSRFQCDCQCECECECLRARVSASANGANGEEGSKGMSACVRVRTLVCECECQRCEGCEGVRGTVHSGEENTIVY